MTLPLSDAGRRFSSASTMSCGGAARRDGRAGGEGAKKKMKNTGAASACRSSNRMELQLSVQDKVRGRARSARLLPVAGAEVDEQDVLVLEPAAAPAVQQQKARKKR